VFAVCMGRGYASFAVLAVWWFVEAVRALRASPRHAFKAIVLAPATRACVLAIGVAALMLSYNIWREAERNDIAWTEVGIIDSARRRLTASHRLNDARKKETAFPRFASVQAERFVENAQPFMGPGIEPKGRGSRNDVLFAIAILGVLGAFIARRKAEVRPPLIVAALSGIVWIFAMRGLTAFHDFTIMFMFAATTVFMYALIHWVPQRIIVLPAIVGCVVLILSTSERNDELRSSDGKGEVYTKDLARIAKHLKPGEAFAHDPSDRRKLVPGVPYAVGWFLPDNPILKGDAPGTLLISNKKNKKNVGKNLTPENSKLFLYRK